MLAGTLVIAGLKAGITPGVMNKIQTAFAGLIPDSVLAAMHRRLAEPR